jgi:hypothetical protein
VHHSNIIAPNFFCGSIKMSTSRAQSDARNDDTLKHFLSRAQQARTNTQGVHLPGNARVVHNERAPPPSRVTQPVQYEFGIRPGHDNFVPYSTVNRALRNNPYGADASGRKFNNTYLMKDSFYGDDDRFTSQGPRY